MVTNRYNKPKANIAPQRNVHQMKMRVKQFLTAIIEIDRLYRRIQEQVRIIFLKHYISSTFDLHFEEFIFNTIYIQSLF